MSGAAGSDPAAEDRFNTYLPLAAWFVNLVSRRSPALADEYRSAVFEALWTAACRYEEARGPFRAFAREHILGACRRVRQNARPLGYRRSAAPPPVIESLAVADTAVDFDQFAAVDARNSMERAWPYLTVDQARVCRLLYWEQQTQYEAAATLGLSRSAVDRLHVAALATLAAALEGTVPAAAALEPGRLGAAAAALRDARRGRTLEAVAAASGLPRHRIRQLEAGLDVPDAAEIDALAIALDARTWSRHGSPWDSGRSRARRRDEPARD